MTSSYGTSCQAGTYEKIRTTVVHRLTKSFHTGSWDARTCLLTALPLTEDTSKHITSKECKSLKTFTGTRKYLLKPLRKIYLLRQFKQELGNLVSCWFPSNECFLSNYLLISDVTCSSLCLPQWSLGTE